jgi:MFS family permease
MIAPLVIAQLILWADWRWMFVIVGVTGFAWAPLWLWFYRLPDKHWLMRRDELQELQKEQSQKTDATPPAKQGMLAGWAEVLRDRQVWGVGLVRFFSD